MFERKIQRGEEHGVKWSIDDTKIDPIIISVKSIDSGKTLTKIHRCMHKPIFGYDVDDIANIENTLDNLIIRLANDGYKGKNEFQGVKE